MFGNIIALKRIRQGGCVANNPVNGKIDDEGNQTGTSDGGLL